MKTILASLFLVSFATTAHARMECSAFQGSPDSGYVAVFNASNSKVVVSAESNAGPQEIARLDCKQPAQRGPRHPDEGSVLFVCAEPVNRDAGYTLNVEASGNGAILATLSESTIGAPRKIATLICQQNWAK